MDKKVATYLLASLLERIKRNQIGTVSSTEEIALQFAIEWMGDGSGLVAADLPQTAANQAARHQIGLVESSGCEQAGLAKFAEPEQLPDISLVLDSLKITDVQDPDVLLCLDFGTAMSKAFASTRDDEHLDLELGKPAGKAGYTIPSSVFITENGKAYFGYEAIDLSQDLVDSGRERLDSIKSWLSNRQGGDLDSEACVLSPGYNPSAIKLTEGDLIRIFLAYLTDMAETSLSDWEVSGSPINRYVKRRFARPCWPNETQAMWADRWMRNLLADAQILADTFHGKWSGGVDVAQIKGAIEKVKRLAEKPDYLIDVGIPEPVAVAAGAFGETDNLRDAFMVVDAGAGTIDFGLFVTTRDMDSDEHKVFQISESIQGLMQAGDKVDGLLRAFIRSKEAYDSSDPQGRNIEADLRRRTRDLKEQLFKKDRVEYALADGTVGVIEKEEFIASPMVQQFARRVEDGFRTSLEAVNESWLRWLAMDGVHLRVILTGGSSKLPMIQALGDGVIEIKGHKILRRTADPLPDWMEDSPEEFREVYPQLAVAIGGAAENLPETAFGPEVFAGGSRTTYVSGRMQVTGI